MSDLDAYIDYRRNKRLHEWLPGKPVYDDKYYKKSLKEIIKGSDNRWVWAIELKEEHKIVGSVSIEDIFEKYKYCEIGYSVNVSYQGMGIAYEAASALIDFCFNELDMHRIEIYVWKGNVASENLAKKLGFTHEGTLRDVRIKDEKYYDEVVYGLLRPEWLSRHSSTKV